MPNSRTSTHPSKPFTRAELVAYALGGGVRERLRTLEQEIARLQKQFPEVMLDGPIVLLKPEVRTDGKTWPLQPPPTKNSRNAASWTPARRKQQAQRMKAQQAKIQRARGTKTATRATAPTARVKTAKASSSWQKMRSALLLAPDYQGTSKEIQAAAGITNVNIAQAFRDYPDVFKKIDKGVYALTTAGKNGAAAE